jgi:hypothetical protein
MFHRDRAPSDIAGPVSRAPLLHSDPESPMFNLRTLLLFFVLSGPVVASAAPSAVVEGIGLPAWVVTDGLREPLTAGRALAAGEMVITGRGSRALLRLDDGSAVKLGEDTRFVVSSARTVEGGSPLFQATLRVLTGAFRFTTSALAKTRMQREVSIQVGAVTAGIRGTDLWGRSDADRDFVVLIEGKIGIRRDGEGEVLLDALRSLFSAPKGAPTPPIGNVTPAELAGYAAQTEIAAGSGAVVAGGIWKVTVLESGEQAVALAAYDQLRDAGYPAIIDPRGRGDAAVYRVGITGLATRADAATLAARLKTTHRFEAAKIRR